MCREFFINRIHSILTIIFSLSKQHKNACILTNEANLHCWQFNERWRPLFCLLHSLRLLHSLSNTLPFNERAVGFTAFSQRLEPCLCCNFRYKSSASWVKSRIFAAAIGSEWIGWKGNRVQIPNSPAPVGSRFLDITSCCHWHFFGKASACPAASQKTCRCNIFLFGLEEAE